MSNVVQKYCAAKKYISWILSSVLYNGKVEVILCVNVQLENQVRKVDDSGKSKYIIIIQQNMID